MTEPDVSRCLDLASYLKEFLALVKAHGEIPRGRGSGAKTYWEAIRQAWNTQRGHEVWKKWDVARKHHGRLVDRIRKKGVER